MKCNGEWLSAYLDGALAEDKRAKLEEHLKTCEACGAKLEEFARVEQAAKKIPAPQLSEAYWENFASRVQNKLTIRERQKTSPAWLEALKSFFQPTAGKLAIAGSMAVIILLTFVSLEQWKKQTFRPPVFESEKPVAEAKIDSIQEPAKDESIFRTAEKDREVGLVEDKRLDQPTPERPTATLSQKPAENRPTASAPSIRALDAAAPQKSNEEPSLSAFAERDEVVKGDTVLVIAGKKAEIRKEVATSQLKVAEEEIEKLPIRNAADLLKVQAAVPTKDNSLSEADSQKALKKGREDMGLSRAREGRLAVQGDTVTVTAGRKAEIRKEIATSQPKVASQPFFPTANSPSMPAIDTVQLITDIKRTIDEKEKVLVGEISQTKAESLYTFLGHYYLSLYRFSHRPGDWNKAHRRINDFLKKELSDSTRQRLLQIQAELKKLKK